jgi:hypothetical protein
MSAFQIFGVRCYAFSSNFWGLYWHNNINCLIEAGFSEMLNEEVKTDSEMKVIVESYRK